MKARSGQVAVYLALVLVAITFLVLMNVGAFLGVSARNTTMNGGDAAALAVAQYQGRLLNQIGQWNVEHLEAALKGDSEACAAIVLRQLRCCFLDPLEGIRIGNDYAKKNACDRNDAMLEILRRHAMDIRLYYTANPDLYPEPWEGAWEEYAQRLEVAIGAGIWAGPDNVDFLNAATGHLLITKDFYHAIAGRSWCWFRFNAPSLLSSYSSYRDWGPLPGRDDETRRRKCVNSEVYSLNLDLRIGSAVDLLGVDLIVRLTEATPEEIEAAPLLNDRRQSWFFFDVGEWRRWWELDPNGEWAFPAMGRVKSEYDVRGCAAMCRVTCGFMNVMQEGRDREAVWSAAAKPFGTVRNLDGETDVVTALRGFVTDAFTDTRLVPLDSVGGRDLSSADAPWMDHVLNHLADYLQNGPNRLRACYYCQQLVTWEHSTFRAQGVRWLKLHAKDCIRPAGGGSGRGGSAHGH